MDKKQLCEEIINGVKSIQGLDFNELTKGDEFGLPRLIPAGNGETIQITKDIDDYISRLARKLKEEKPQLVKNVRDEEWRSWLRSTIGPALMQINLSDPVASSSAKMLQDIAKEIDVLVSSFGPSEYAFGTTFLNIPILKPFSMGPVKFEMREYWLDRKLDDGSITPEIHRRILRVWAGRKIKPRSKRIDNIREEDIIDTIGDSRFVCSVSVDGLSGEAGREIALTAARLGLTCVSLLWARSSNALSGMYLRGDGGRRRERILRFVPGRITLQGSRIHGKPSGPRITADEWGSTVSTNSNFLSAAGELLAYQVSSDGQVSRPKLMNALMQSLLWFYEGCRESNDLLAVVDFAASLDALGGGKKGRAIVEVLEARVGAQGDQPIYQDGPTLKTLIDTIYSDGRSRAIHGTSDKIGHDWTRARGHAESIARLALNASLDWAAANPTAQDPDLLKK